MTWSCLSYKIPKSVLEMQHCASCKDNSKHHETRPNSKLVGFAAWTLLSVAFLSSAFYCKQLLTCTKHSTTFRIVKHFSYFLSRKKPQTWYGAVHWIVFQNVRILYCVSVKAINHSLLTYFSTSIGTLYWTNEIDCSEFRANGLLTWGLSMLIVLEDPLSMIVTTAFCVYILWHN